MGVQYFKYLLILFFWGRKKNRKKYFDGSKKGFENLIFQSKQSEIGHLGAFVSIFIVSVLLLLKGYLLLVLFMTIINVIGNVYPILLQRHHRARVGRILKKL
jgi:hypothetical protein